MNVREAVAHRRSMRAFRPDPIDIDAVRSILTLAARAPSGANLQPWHVHVLAGAARNRLVERVRALLPEKPHGETPDYRIHPDPLTEPYHGRYMRASELMYGAAGIRRDDAKARAAHLARNWEFFGAPVGLILTIDRNMGPPQWADVGMFLQNIMLLALEHGLDSCAQEAWALWPSVLRELLPIPDGHMVYCGLALGHGDAAAPINSFRSERAELAEFSQFHLD